MTKTIPLSKIQEWKGLDRISQIVHEMPCIFREISKDDFGIDGEIEALIPKPEGKGLETTGGILKVQAKSGESYVKQDSNDSFATPVSKDNLLLWHDSNVPVLFIVYHPTDDRLYWKEVKSYVRSTPSIWQPPYRIVFNKAADEFNTRCRSTICSLASVSPPRISFDQKERLYSNFLLIKRKPRLLVCSPTDYKRFDQIRSQIRGFVPPFCIVDGRLYSLADLRDERCVLRDYCDTHNISDIDADQWAKDIVRQKDYVFLLNQSLGIHLRNCGLRYNPHFRRNYFPRQDEAQREFRQDWFNVRTSRAAPSRIIAKYYEYGLHHFWRHLAVNLSFKVVGASWFLQIIPKYFFTTDGETPWDRDKVGPFTTAQKAHERNNHVLNHVLFWADVLSQQKPVIRMKLGHATLMEIEKEPLSGIADFAIPDDPARYEEVEDTGQLDFLGMLGNDKEGADEDEY